MSTQWNTISKKKWAADTHNNMDKSQKHHVKWTEARHKRLRNLLFHLYEISRKGQTREISRSDGGCLGLEVESRDGLQRV